MVCGGWNGVQEELPCSVSLRKKSAGEYWSVPNPPDCWVWALLHWSIHSVHVLSQHSCLGAIPSRGSHHNLLLTGLPESLFHVAKAILHRALPTPEEVTNTTAPARLPHLPPSSLTTLTPQPGRALPASLPCQARPSLWGLYLSLLPPHRPSPRSPRSWPFIILLFFAQIPPLQRGLSWYSVKQPLYSLPSSHPAIACHPVL